MLALKILRKSLAQLNLLAPFRSKAEMIGTFLSEGNAIPNLFSVSLQVSY